MTPRGTWRASTVTFRTRSVSKGSVPDVVGRSPTQGGNLQSARGSGWLRPVGRIGAELLVIILGVLVALTADAWRQSREERQAEANHLEALRDDIEASMTLLQSSNTQRARLFASLVHLADDDLDRVPGDTVARWVYDGLFLVAGYETRLVALRDLQTSDQLRLLAPRVRREIAELDRRLSELDRVENDFLQSQQGLMDPYLVDRIPLAQILTMADSLPLSGTGVSALSWTSLRTQQLRNAIAFKLSLGRVANGRRDALLAQLETLLSVIDVRLDELGRFHEPG